MKNGKCRFHGRASTGPKTAEGKKAQRASVTKHGYRGDLGRVLGDIRRILSIQTRYAVLRVRDHPIHNPDATTTPAPTQVIASGNCPNMRNPTATDPNN